MRGRIIYADLTLKEIPASPRNQPREITVRKKIVTVQAKESMYDKYREAFERAIAKCHGIDALRSKWVITGWEELKYLGETEYHVEVQGVEN